MACVSRRPLPADLGAHTDGTVLRSRESTVFGINLPIKVWQVQYKSTDARGRPTPGVATVLVPDTPWNGAGARPLVSYQMAEDGLGIQCASSYVRVGTQAGPGKDADQEAPVASLMLLRNWAVDVSTTPCPSHRPTR